MTEKKKLESVESMVPLVIIIITITYAFISHHKVITSKAATTSDYKEQYQMLLPV